MRKLLCALLLTTCISGMANAQQKAEANKGGCAVNILGNNNLVRCKDLPLIPCTDVDYGNEQYHENMAKLAHEIGLPNDYYNKYQESAVAAICEGKDENLKELIDDGFVKATEIAALKRVLVPDSRSATGKRYGDSLEQFLTMGLCSACAGNVAQYYSRKPSSDCGKLADKALRGDAQAIAKLRSFPDYCQWTPWR